jgi:hypothetical protein
MVAKHLGGAAVCTDSGLVLAQVWDEEENLVESKCSGCIILTYL